MWGTYVGPIVWFGLRTPELKKLRQAKVEAPAESAPTVVLHLPAEVVIAAGEVEGMVTDESKPFPEAEESVEAEAEADEAMPFLAAGGDMVYAPSGARMLQRSRHRHTRAGAPPATAVPAAFAAPRHGIHNRGVLLACPTCLGLGRGGNTWARVDRSVPPPVASGHNTAMRGYATVAHCVCVSPTARDLLHSCNAIANTRRNTSKLSEETHRAVIPLHATRMNYQ